MTKFNTTSVQYHSCAYLRLTTAVLLLILFSITGYSQLTFSNPSFEGPPGVGITPAPWTVCSGTADTQPGQFEITGAASHGNSYIGLVGNEAAGQKLSGPMVAGNEYILKLDIYTSPLYRSCPAAATLRIYGSNIDCGKTQLLWESPTPTNAWVTYTAILKPTTNYTHITFFNESLLLSNVMFDNLQPIVLTKPTPKFTATSVCEGLVSTFTDASVAGSAAITKWTWNFGDPANSTSNQQNPTFTYPSAGTYNVKLEVEGADGKKDNITVPIKVFPNPTGFTEQITDASCGQANGSIKAKNVTGGTPTFTFSFNGGAFDPNDTFTGLAPTSTTIVVKDSKGCIFTKTVTVADKPGPSAITSTTTNSTCTNSNGSVTITSTTGGTNPYTYSFDGAAFSSVTTYPNLAPGTHTISVKDFNGCSYTSTVTINISSGPTGIVTTIVNTTCTQSNGSIDITSITGGTAPYQYAFNGPYGGITTYSSLDAGIYSLRVKDANDCEFTKQVTLTDTPGPDGMITTTTKASCGSPTGSITVTSVSGGKAPYTYAIDSDPYGTSKNFPGLAAGGYTIHVMDANNCTYDFIESVTDQGAPTSANVKTANALCGQSNGSITITNVVGGVAPYTYSLDGGTPQSTGLFTGLIAKTYAIDIIAGNGCVYSVSATVKDTPGQNSATKTIVDETCTLANGTYTISGVVGGKLPFTYALNGGTFSTVNTFTSLAAGNYSVVVKDANGCTLKLDTFLIDHPGPTSFNTTILPELCSGSNGSIVVTGVTGGTAPIEYALNGGNYAPSGTFSSLSSGNKIVYAKDKNGCILSLPLVVPASPSPTDLDFTHVASTCSQSNGSITIVQTVGGTAPYIYSLDGQTPTASLTFQNVTAGLHLISLTDANGCTYQENYTVTDFAAPTAIQLSSVQPSCGFNNGSITINGITGGTAPFLYKINNGTASSQQFYPALTPGSHTITAIDANGCMVSNSPLLTDQPGPAAVTLSLTGSTCSLANGKVVVDTVTPGTAPYSYSLDGTNFTTGNTFSNLAAGSYTIYVKDANGCSYSETFTITHSPAASDFTVSQVTSKCTLANGSLTISGVIGGKSPFTYSNSGVSGPFKVSATFLNLATNTYSMAVKDANGCITSKQAVLLDQPGPTAFTLRDVSTTCGNSNGELHVENVVGGKPGYKYSLNGGTFGPDSNFTALPANVTHTIVVRDANNCTLSQTIVIMDIAGPTDIDASSISSTCTNPNGSLTIDLVTGGTAPYNYSIPGVNFSSFNSFSGLQTASYNITIKDANGCLYTESTFVPDMPSPTGFDAEIQAENCKRSDGVIEVKSVSGGTSPYTYLLNNQAFSQPTIQDVLSTGTYSVTVTDANGCTYTENVTVPYLGYPKADFTFDPSSGDAPLVVNFTNQSTDGATYNWTFGTGEGSTDENTYCSYADSGSYLVTLTTYNTNGCADSITKTIKVKKPIYVFIPNSFSPNNDGINDVFNASTYGLKWYTISIYNRWGEQLTEWTQEDRGWDGSYLGLPVKEDTYIWVFTGQDEYGKKHHYKGSLTLMAY